MKQELIKDLKRSYGIALVTAEALGKAEQVDSSAGWTARMVSVTTHPVDEPETENHLITIRIRKNKDNYTLEVLAKSVEGTRDFDDIDEARIEGLEQNQDFFSLLLNDEEIKREVLGIFTEEIYSSLKNS